MKYIDGGWEKLYLNQEVDAFISPSNFSSTLRSIGKDWESQRRFFRGLMKEGDTILFDLSAFSSTMRMFSFLRRYDSHRLNLRQIKFAIAFSCGDFISIALIPGSVRDVKFIISFLREFDVQKSIFVLDRGSFPITT
ncbi:MAG: hypothetical protein QXJ24_05530 [Thermoplasmatales archaeon]